ncbi:MAG: RNA 2',3'-cyclic phosphodiesterase [Planctomycetota bacterium]
MRTFIAVEIDRTLCNRLAAIQQDCGISNPVMRWVKPDRMHLTLRFLGEINAASVTDVTRAMQNASEGVEPFDIQFKGLGFFPNASKPRVFWVGIMDPDKTLEILVRSLELELLKIGFERDRKAFRPHLTLARIRDGVPGGLEVSGEKDKLYGQQCVSAIKLFMSELKPQGPIYTPLSVVKLQ